VSGETEAFDIDVELSALWQKAYCAMRDVVRKQDGAEISLHGCVRSAKVDEDGLLLFQDQSGTYELAECFSDNVMFSVLRTVLSA